MDRPPERLRLVLELEGSSEPLAGRLLGPAQRTADFRGWLEFVSALEGARADARRSESADHTAEARPER